MPTSKPKKAKEPMKIFRVQYSLLGSCDIKARNLKEAEEKADNGQYRQTRGSESTVEVYVQPEPIK